MYWDDDWAFGRGDVPRVHLTLVDGPAVDPITVQDAKDHARLSQDEEDGQVLNWIKAATRKLERDTELALITQTWDLSFSRFPFSVGALEIPIRPVQSITSVKYYDSLGVLQTMPAGNYVLEASTLRLGLVVNAQWPSDVRATQSVTVRVVAGYTSVDLVPEDLKQAIRLLVAHFSEMRQPVSLGESVTVIDLTYDALIEPYVRHLAA
jgi:uncharacterized phiE125 gp8 family phage protein